ncbi:hypothetical protein Tco_1190139, partial [Tanacetum coccineum]
YKARLVANGRSRQFGVDCDDTFSHVVKPAIVRAVLSLALWNGYLRKGRKTKPKRQNQTRNGKAGKRQSQSPSPSVEKST